MLEEKIQDLIKDALKGGEKVKVSVLRMLINEIKNKKIADRASELDDEKVIGLIQKMVSRHKESIEGFKQGGREDLVEKETEEMKILAEFLPEPLSEEELERIIVESIETLGAESMKDMGKVMSDVAQRVQGRADGKTISSIVKQKLGN